MKMMGRAHRPFFRVCAIDQRKPRDGRVIEELGYYDPMCPETDARAVLKADRLDYWVSVGAQPSDRVKTLMKKYGTGGTHLEAQKAANERLAARRKYTPAPFVAAKPSKSQAPPSVVAPGAETPAEEAPADAT